MKCLDAIENRCSIRNFSDKKVPWDKIIEAIDAANHAPFAGNINNLKFIIIQNPKTIKKLTECCQQSWISKSSILVVVCANTKKLEEHYQDRGYDYSKQQVGAAIQNFLLRITELNLASCWVGAFIDEEIRNELKIPEEYEIEALLPVGQITHKKPKYSKKAKVETKIFWEAWDIKNKPTRFKDPRS
jgi:nitroreductase